MSRTVVVMAALAMLSVGVQVDAQGRRNGQTKRTRNEIARAQGIPPGQMPPANMCRVWYDNRANGRQPAATSCTEAERIANRDGNARVVYGENVYDDYRYNRDRYGYGNNGNQRYPSTGGNDRAVPRVPGRNRDPRVNDPYFPASNDPYYDRSRYTAPGFQNGYRDGLDKGREDAEDEDDYDVNRHSWYRSATRGYEDEYGTRADYQARYRDGFQAGYGEGYRAFTRR